MPSKLFETLNIRKLKLENRIVIAPMCQYSAHEGSATDWHKVHLGTLAQSNAGLLIIEATAVTPEGRISPDDLGLYSDANELALQETLKVIRNTSPMPLAIQLAHAGRKASTYAPWKIINHKKQIAPSEVDGWQTVAPSALAFESNEVPPTELSVTEIKNLIHAFARAAERSARLGLNAIEIHAAHGYLLHQFMSPISNQRTDYYGGSFENRIRFTIEVFKAVREVLPKDFPVWIRISATDWCENGWDLAQSVELIKILKTIGCDAVHVSSGGLSPLQKINTGPGYQVPFAETLKKETGLLCIAVGEITEARQAEKILQNGQADAIALARAILYNPRWPWHAAAELGAQVKASNQFWRSPPAGVVKLFQR